MKNTTECCDSAFSGHPSGLANDNVLYHSLSAWTSCNRLFESLGREADVLRNRRARLDLAGLGASSRTEADRLDGNNLARYGLVVSQETSQSGLLTEIRAIAAEICNVEEVSNGPEY